MALGGGTGYGVSLVARILLTSDYHRLSVPVGKQKGQALKFHEKLFEAFINIWKRWNLAYALPAMRRKIFRLTTKDADFDCHIICGDVIESEYNERGMIKPIDQQIMRAVVSTMPDGVLHEKRFVVPGDHELGYRLSLSSDPGGGISTESIDCFIQAVGPLWQSFSVENVRFVLLCSSLMIQKTDHLSREEQHSIKMLEQTQGFFLQAEILSSKEDEKIFVFMHDPDGITYLDNCVVDCARQGVQRQIKVFCGHMHASFVPHLNDLVGDLAKSNFSQKLAAKYARWNMIHEWALGNLKRKKLFEKYALQVIPASGGFLGLGGGFLVMELYSDGGYKIKKM